MHAFHSSLLLRHFYPFDLSLPHDGAVVWSPLIAPGYLLLVLVLGLIRYFRHLANTVASRYPA